MAPVACDEDKYQTIVGSETYQTLYDHDSICYPDDSELPDDMPEAYKQPTVQSLNIKGVPMVKLYIPAVAKDQTLVQHFLYTALPTVLSNLFGRDIVQIQTKECMEYESFLEARPCILVSVNDRNASHQTPEPMAL